MFERDELWAVFPVLLFWPLVPQKTSPTASFSSAQETEDRLLDFATRRCVFEFALLLPFFDRPAESGSLSFFVSCLTFPAIAAPPTPFSWPGGAIPLKTFISGSPRKARTGSNESPLPDKIVESLRSARFFFSPLPEECRLNAQSPLFFAQEGRS